MADERLVAYLKNQLAKGRKVEDVRKVLLDQGWRERDIAEAVSEIAAIPIPPVTRPPAEAPKPPEAPKKRWWPKAVIAIGVVLIVLALLGLLFPEFLSFLGF
ncbi:MAG: hypothetical protein ACE5FW_01160 [Candidatus Aenigmatarchaeota archaeon]